MGWYVCVCVSGGEVVPPREGGCWTGIFESLIICSLWNRVVKLMAKFQGVPKAIYGGSIGKIGKCILVDMQIFPEMLIGLT